MRHLRFLLLVLLACAAQAQTDSLYLLKPAQVFDGEQMHRNWTVLVRHNRIESVGEMPASLPKGVKVIDLPGTTLLPG